MKQLLLSFVFLLFFMPLQAQQTIEQQVQASSDASDAWLEFVDQDRYGESWDKASDLFKLTIPKGDWVALLNKVRRPLGNKTSREMVDIRTAKDPQGLPAGDYMVILYNSSFSSKPSAHELVTLRLEGGEWKVLTYQVK